MAKRERGATGPADGGGDDPVDRIVEQWRRERPDLDPTPMATWGRLGRLHQLAGRRIEAVFAEHGLNIGEFDVLAALRRSGEPHQLSPGVLGRQLMLSSAAMTNRLDRLEAAGLVRRSPDPTDRRALLVTLTGEGLRRVDAAVGDHLANEEAMLSALDRSERRRLDTLLGKLLAGLDAAEG